MSCPVRKEAPQPRLKRLKTWQATPSDRIENERPRQCYCFEKSECVVRKLRVERLKQFSGVRRKLDFGPEDNNTTGNSSLLLSQDDSLKVWNFDFETETPLSGQWGWVKLEQPVLKSVEDKEEAKNTSSKPKTLKELFRVSKNVSQKRGVDHQFRSPLAPIRSTETSPA